MAEREKPASVNRELAILSGIFRMAVDYDEIPQNPCREGAIAAGEKLANSSSILRGGT